MKLVDKIELWMEEVRGRCPERRRAVSKGVVYYGTCEMMPASTICSHEICPKRKELSELKTEEFNVWW